MNKCWKVAFLMTVGLLAAACESGLGNTAFVVLPDADGTVGQITVDDGSNQQILNEAYAAADIKNGKLRKTKTEQGEVQQVFGKALAAQPVLPTKFMVNFETNTDTLTQASIAVLDQVIADIERRAAYLVEVVGHTDSQASDKYNAQLSLRRASSVRNFLIEKGIKEDTIYATGRGEKDPLIPTGDKVTEPRNRRVEITVR
jgi:outer membrane protein OmpA-like peptidoglycan-associated protein